jgi:hypothetical protein
MLLTIVAIWAIVIPLVVLALSWQLANMRDTRAVEPAHGSASRRGTSRPAGSVPRCAVPAGRPRRTTTRRVCPELPRGVRRRPASA